MRVCDYCKKPLPMGHRDIIEVRFFGKFSELMRKIYGTDSLDFCSLECFDKFSILKIKEERLKKK